MDFSNKEDEYINQLFSKIYAFDCKNINLPNPNVLFSSERWEDPNFIILKEEMNKQKSRLNDYNLGDWHEHTYNTNHAKYISREIRNRGSPELLTNAWTKFYECLYKFNIIPELAKNNYELNSVHLCEAPGAFITSLNHFIKSNYPEIKFKWMATTLNPYYEGNSLSTMINDDRFMRPSLNNWHFGLDWTGNLMDWDNSQCLINDSKKTLGKIFLVTADGSIDCSLTPGEQESTVSSLFYCEIITALQILEKGGTFVVKTFTIYEHSSINLIYILCASFNTVNCFKPVTSKSGNSEIYLICIDYKGFEIIVPYMEVFKKFYNSNENVKSIIPYDELPTKFISDIREASELFHRHQYNIIGNNILLFNTKDKYLYEELQNIQNKVRDLFFETYYLRKINVYDKICKPSDYNYRNRPNMNEKRSNNGDSYSEMVSVNNENTDNRFVMILNKFNAIRNIYANRLPASINFEKILKPLIPRITTGKPIVKVLCSFFVDEELLKLYNDINEYYHKILPFSRLHKCEKIKNNYLIEFFNYNLSNDYAKWEKSSVSILKSTINKMKFGENLHIKNVNLLTQYSVGILYLLIKSFTNVTFHNVNCIELINLRDKSTLINTFNKILEHQNCFENSTILGILPLHLLFEQEFYNLIINFNNNNVYKYIMEKLK